MKTWTTRTCNQMDSKDTCPIGGSHKWIYDIVGEKSCTKCGLWKKDTSEVGYSAEKGDYGLGGIVGKKGSGRIDATAHDETEKTAVSTVAF